MLRFTLFLLFALPSFGAYLFTVNTSSISGTNGFVEFQLGPGSQDLTATISGFTPAGNLGAVDPSSFGLFSGDLATTLVLGPGVQTDYFRHFTFGSSLRFLVDLSGPALSSPNPAALAGNVFAFSLFDSAGTSPLLTSDTTNGSLARIDVAPGTGAVSITQFDFPSGILSITNVPEPATLGVCALGLIALGVMRSRNLLNIGR